ncbi:sigma-70 family RNA polymerase sigma factor [Sediminitomix flava]|uniref:RNA polymerase sigma (SigZ) subunit n=1 Tax=Sediminitomix flava TaxID=379075 RepID=A0A315ZZV8_SEDFL|nr:sigma-70 family RNA polymerase sigma factor [Sediminitomix flava]PWJ42917.1 RNA polymerase sigma (SigZ) subunit [Sediminitomix flava]
MKEGKYCDINSIVKEFYTFLKAYLIKKTGDENLAEDVVQEVMIKLIESCQGEKEIGNLKAWLFQVSRNTLYDFYQKNKLEISFGDEWEKQDGAAEIPKLLTEDYIIPMIQLLPEKNAQILMMSDIEQKPQKEIAEQLGLGLSATKMRIQRARTQLYQLFVDCCEIEYDQNGSFVSCTIKDQCDDLQNIQKDLNKKIL